MLQSDENVYPCPSPCTDGSSISYLVWDGKVTTYSTKQLPTRVQETDCTPHHDAIYRDMLFLTPPLKSWISVCEQLHEVGLQTEPRQSDRSIHSRPATLIGQHTWNQVPASGAGCKASLYPQCASYRVAELSEVPSLSPPGFTQTKASTSASPVLVVGRTPKPVLMTLHQSPQACWPVGCFPLRPRS